MFKPNEIYSFDFWYQLPEDIPSSLSGKHGKIRYYVEASLKTLYDYEIFTKLPFTIIRFENLSARLDLMERRCEETVANLCCLSWKTKPLIISATIPYSGFAAGQTIRAQIIVDNRCGFDVYETILSLKRVHTFVSSVPEEKVMRDSKNIVKVVCEGVKSGKRKKIAGIIEIPPMTLNTSESLCKACQLSYILQVKTNVVGFLQSPKIQFNIVIGMKPLNFENKLNC